MRAWLLEAAAPLSATALLLAGVVSLGRLAEDDLRPHARYAARFAEVRCDPPPGLSSADFLREVQYEADLPDRLDRFDRNLPANLSDAFRRHAWVEEVERVEVPACGPVRVRLRYRTAALAVPDREQVRVVDAHGVLLPRAAAARVPGFRGPAPRAGATGTPWESARVVAAARTAGFLLPQNDRLQVEALEVVGGDLVLWTAGGSCVLWGSPPGEERAGEATAVLKRDRLLDRLARPPVEVSRGPSEYDLRPAAGARQRPLTELIQVGARGGS